MYRSLYKTQQKRRKVINVAENGNGNVLTLPEVAKKLQVSPTWLYKKCKAGIIPHIRIGRMVRFRQHDLDRWMNDHRIEGAQKI